MPIKSPFSKMQYFSTISFCNKPADYFPFLSLKQILRQILYKGNQQSLSLGNFLSMDSQLFLSEGILLIQLKQSHYSRPSYLP